MVTSLSEQLLKNLLNDAQLVYFSLDLDYRYIAFSKKHREIMKNIWGTDIQVGMNILDVIQDFEDRLKAKKNFDRVIESSESIILEEEYGDDALFRTIWKNQYLPIINSDNNIIGVSVIVEDMTYKIQQNNYIKNMELFSKVVNLVSNGVVIVDVTKESLPVIFINEYFKNLTGYVLEDFEGRGLNILQADDREQEAIKVMKKAIVNEESCEVELRNYKKDGMLFYNRVSLSPIFNEENELILYVGIQKDITAEVNKNNLLQKVFDFQENILFVTDGKKPSFINTSFKKFYEIANVNEYMQRYKRCVCNTFKRDERFFSFLNVKSNQNWLEVLELLEEPQRKVLIISPNGEERIFNISITPFEKSKYIVSMTDISATFFEQLHLKDKVNYGTLTQAYSREFFNQNILSIINAIEGEGKQLGVSIMDIDFFKNVNDVYGHDIGDIVLKSLVNIIKKNIRQDDYVIRWGGEEFLLLIPVQNIIKLEKILDNVRKEIEKAIIIENIRITVSVGLTILEKNNIEESIKKADIALYESKNSGRNRVKKFTDKTQ